MKIVFMGTPDFAVPSLKRLVADGHTLPLVVTQADKPKGRGHALAAPPVKEYALSQGLEVYQPATLKSDEAFARLEAADPELIVVVAYGRLLPPRVLELPRRGCINVHASLLPHYRGAAPVQWAVLNGETEAGVTTMRMAEGLDTGDMLLQSRRPLPDTMTSEELLECLAQDGAQLLAKTLQKLEQGTLTATPQDDQMATYAPMLDKTLSPMDWTRSAAALHNQVRGLQRWPCASCQMEEKPLKIHRTMVGDACNARPGTVIGVSPLTVACGGGTSLIVLEVQAEGGKRMKTEEFLRGHAVAVGMVLK